MFNLGFLEIEVNGLNIEKFLNLLNKEGVFVCFVDKKEFNNFCIKIPYIHYKKFLEIAGKMCYNISVKKVTGLKKYLNFFKSRIALTIGILVIAIFMPFINLFLFQFSINGNKTISDEQICAVLDKNNISVGSFKQNIDTKNVEKILLGEFKNISLVSCSMLGNTLLINIKEKIIVDKNENNFIYE